MNIAILKGNCGADPRITSFENGGKVADFSLATTKRGFTKDDGTKVEDTTQWHRVCVTRKGLVGVVESYVKKGTALLVKGEIRYRKYTDQNGIERDLAEIYADEIELLGSKPERPEAPAPKAEDDLPWEG